MQHYDGYDKDDDGTEDLAYSAPSAQAASFESTKSIFVRGLPTMSLDAGLPANTTPSPTSYFTTATFYDNRELHPTLLPLHLTRGARTQVQ